MVKKISLELVTAICNDVVEDVLESIITGNVNLGVGENVEQTDLQREALILAKRFVERGEKIPDVVLRAAKEKWNELGPLRLEDIVANSTEFIDQSMKFG